MYKCEKQWYTLLSFSDIGNSWYFPLLTSLHSIKPLGYFVVSCLVLFYPFSGVELLFCKFILLNVYFISHILLFTYGPNSLWEIQISKKRHGFFLDNKYNSSDSNVLTRVLHSLIWTRRSGHKPSHVSRQGMESRTH